MWTKNILEGVHKYVSIDLEVLPLNRNAYVGEEMGFVKRVFEGGRDYLRHYISFKKNIQKKKPDIVHLCTSGSISFIKDILFLRAAKKKSIKTVIHFHFGRIPDILSRNTWECRLLKRVCKLSDCLITMDKGSHMALSSIGFKALYVPNPVSDFVLNKTKESIIKRQFNKILFVGHLDLAKGIIDLVNACLKLPKIELHIVGRPIENVVSMITSISTLKDDGSWLYIRGEMSHCEVINEMLSSNVFCLPSYTEGFPNVILESMAASCKIVSTSVGAIPEMLAVNSTSPCGICIAPGDVLQLSKALSTMLETNINYGERAAARVREHYSIEHISQVLKEIWLGLVKGIS